MRRDESPAGAHAYFLEREQVPAVWQRLVARFGAPRRGPGFRGIELATPRYTLRSTLLGNPITVQPSRVCTPADLAELHALLGYEE